MTSNQLEASRVEELQMSFNGRTPNIMITIIALLLALSKITLAAKLQSLWKKAVNFAIGGICTAPIDVSGLTRHSQIIATCNANANDNTFNENKDNTVPLSRGSINKLASKLPGYGEADIYYPANWIGKWQMKEVVTSMQPPAPTQANKDTSSTGMNSNNVKVAYPSIVQAERRFLEQKSPIITDIEFIATTIDNNNNQGTIVNRAAHLSSEFQTLLKTPAITFWQADNPNVARIDLPYLQQSVNILVSKRSVESIESTSDINQKGQTAAPAVVGYSEFYRIAESQGDSSITTNSPLSNYENKKIVPQVPSIPKVNHT